MKKLIFAFLLAFGISAQASPQSFFMLVGVGAAPAQSSGIDSLTTITISNQATADVDLSSWYTTYSIIIIQIYNLQPATNNTDLWMLTSTDGSTYANSANNYQWTFVYSVAGATNGGGGSAGDTKIVLGQALGNTSTYSASFGIEIFNPASSAFNPTYVSNVSYTNNSGAVVTANGASARQAAQINRANRFMMSSGNISCKIKVLGIK